MTKYLREEKDGSTTYIHAQENWTGKLETHNSKGPALTNKTQEISEYYLYGVKMTKDEWQKKCKIS
tara:strand:- start:442 stop:639 length:198 start_codon:yes stop_codon:yes gene_type:complete